LNEVTKLWQLEVMRNKAADRKKMLASESSRYISECTRAAGLHGELRLSMLDRKAAGLPAVKITSNRLLKMKQELVILEKEQQSRKDLVYLLSSRLNCSAFSNF
jgi:hypothetical protein